VLKAEGAKKGCVGCCYFPWSAQHIRVTSFASDERATHSLETNLVKRDQQHLLGARVDPAGLSVKMRLSLLLGL